ncbi:MAG: hypothetical protein COT21_01160 [Hadesarchaea archaeon CG08_land_8_20_14_0_20_51_8]|nr:MAG: hypothetical protein COT21_01160 [Hadesarchaea archaeon CG08_land_8_20_14_0_20_51_8]
MKVLTISRKDIQSTIDEEWKIAEDFLSGLAKAQGMSLPGIKRKHHIRKPHIKDVIEDCLVLCEDEFM